VQEQDNAPLAVLSRRFAMRLDTALDLAGYPALKPARLRALATAQGIDISAATTLSSGLALPTYEQLLALCSLLSQQPGYFLDEHLLNVPPGTVVVKPVSVGEDLVLRLPSDELDAETAWAGLCYWRTPLDLGFGIAAGEFLIARGQATDFSAQPRHLYLYRGPRGYDVLQCSEVQGHRAVFQHDGANSVPIIIPTKRGDRARPVSPLIARIKCGSSLRAAV
jgi:hypothetical protein